jgi:glycosyltransferase involved in cell wall biosynthesis
MRLQVEERVRRSNLNGRVHLAGYRDNIEQFYAAMTVVLLTSKFEGLPMVALEAMRQGIPVVSTNVGGMSECVDDTVGALLPADATAGEIAEAILVFLRRLETDESIDRRCRERIQERFSLGRMQAAYRATLEQFCSRRDLDRRLRDYEKWLMTRPLLGGSR